MVFSEMRIEELEFSAKASSDRNRIRILNMLSKKKMCVCELAFVLEITQPSVSRHLKKLKKAGFIDSEQEGLWTNYFIRPENRYAELFIDNLPLLLGDGQSVAGDIEKMKKADREKICCVKNGGKS